MALIFYLKRLVNRRLTLYLFLIYINCYSSAAAGSEGNFSQYNQERQLIKKLFTNYEKDIAPVEDANSVITVKFGVALRQIIDVDERNQIITVNVWLRMRWDDCMLQWKPEEHANITTIYVHQDKVWMPDVVLYSNADIRDDTFMKTALSITSDGEVTWLSPAIYKSSCKMNIRYFPFDDQICELRFGSWAYDSSKLDITNYSLAGDITNYVDNGEWDLLSMPQQRHVQKYDCCEYPYVDLTFYIHLRRRTLFYVFNLLVPCILFTVLALLAFFLPPESGERISLTITTLLSLIVFLLLVAEFLPPTSEVIPLISIYYAATMILVFLSLVMSCITLSYYHYGWIKPRVSARIRYFMFKKLAKFFNMVPPIRPESGIGSIKMKNYLRSNQCTSHLGFDNENNNNNNGNLTTNGETSRKSQFKISQQFDALIGYAQATEEKDFQANEWKFTAIVLDKIFLWVYSIITISVTLAILLDALNSGLNLQQRLAESKTNQTT